MTDQPLTCWYCDEEQGFCDCEQQLVPFDQNVCAQCGIPLGETYERYREYSYRCKHCQEHYHFFSAHRSYAAYDTILKQAILDYKYHGKIYFSRLFAQHLQTVCDVYSDIYEQVDLLTFVPAHWTRTWQRGYNQSKELAQILSVLLGKPMSSLLQRTKRTKRLKNLSRKDRYQELHESFSCLSQQMPLVKDQIILLIDDIYTTGATMDACAKALYFAGAKGVVALTVARTLEEKEYKN